MPASRAEQHVRCADGTGARFSRRDGYRLGQLGPRNDAAHSGPSPTDTVSQSWTLESGIQVWAGWVRRGLSWAWRRRAPRVVPLRACVLIVSSHRDSGHALTASLRLHRLFKPHLHLVTVCDAGG